MQLRLLFQCFHNTVGWRTVSARFFALSSLRSPSPASRVGVSTGRGITYVQKSCNHTGPRLGLITPLFLQVQKFANRTAIVDSNGSYSYGDIIYYANLLADRIVDELKSSNDDTNGERVCVLCPNDASYMVAQMASWMSGSIVVALSHKHPPAQLEYFIQDSQCKVVIATEDLLDLLKGVKMNDVHLLPLKKSDYFDREDECEINDELLKNRNARWANRLNRLQQLAEANKFKHRAAFIVYTSGTTGNPKGVVHTYGSLQAQIFGMIDRWAWSPNDVLLHVLPLHHVHGNINALMTPMTCGACCVMLPQFDPAQVWSKLLSPVNEGLPRSINLFMAVPTIYAKLIENHDQRLNRGRGTRHVKNYIKSVCSSKIRLFVSGSAALPSPIMHRWEEITGHTMLERYGMTELGMVLGNPLHGQRIPGAVGQPFPYVEVCVARLNVDAQNGYDVLAQGNSARTTVTPGCEGQDGELYVRGLTVFREYWNKQQATKDSFTPDGWFKTGDTAVYENGVYRLLGRTSVDIIKSGGYKISALDVERCLLSHPNIAEVAVVGLTDITWGQKVAAVVVLKAGSAELTLPQLRDWAKDLLPPYQIPTVLQIINVMPRNAMGKVNKKSLVREVFGK